MIDKVCFVAGGAGYVGEGIVRALIGVGWKVVVSSRSDEKLKALKGLIGSERLILMKGNLGNEEEARRLRHEVQRDHGPIDAVVASLGGGWQKRLPFLETPTETFIEFFRNNLVPHLIVLRTFLPELAKRKGTHYVLIGGLSALLPLVNYAPVGACSAGQLKLVRDVTKELDTAQVAIHQVMFGPISTRETDEKADPRWIDALQVGDFIAYLARSRLGSSVHEIGNCPPPQAAGIALGDLP